MAISRVLANLPWKYPAEANVHLDIVFQVFEESPILVPLFHRGTRVYMCIILKACIAFLLFLDDVTDDLDHNKPFELNAY